MDPNYIPELVKPLTEDGYHYSKGNRFYFIDFLISMPKLRIFGNLVLSFMTKLSTGYWNIFDPNNGYTAIRTEYLKRIRLSKVSQRYFFESDMLYHLKLSGAKVIDVPMRAIYGSENSSLKIRQIILEFPRKHLANTLKRVVYCYFLRDFSIASLELVLGFLLLFFGFFNAFTHYLKGIHSDIPTPTGTLVLITITILAGMQFLLNFISADMNSN